MATTLGKAGANVVITARREEQLLEARGALEQDGISCLALTADVSNPDDVQRVVDATLERFGRMDVLVNNAGITWGATPEDMPLDRWQKVMDINVTGMFLMSQTAGRHMLERGSGAIINISSVAGLIGCDPDILDALGYSTSKGAVVAFTRDLAVKWGPRGIRVNAIAPGFFPTRMTRHLLDEGGSEVAARTALRRLGEHEDLAGVLLLLASDAGAYITGQTIAVDGGMSCL